MIPSLFAPWSRKRGRPLFEPAATATVTLPPLERFVARERFAVGAIAGCRPIGHLGRTLILHLLDIVEGPLPDVTLQGRTLTRYATDLAIIAALGGERRATQPLARVIQLMETPEACREDGKENVLYASTPLDRRRRKLWAVHWKVLQGGEWCVAAYPATYPVGWDVGDNIIGA